MRWVELGAVAATLFAAVVYAAALAAQSDQPVELISWIVEASTLAAAVTAAAGAVVASPGARIVLFGWTAVTTATWAFLGAASVGAAYVPAVVLAFVAARRARARD